MIKFLLLVLILNLSGNQGTPIADRYLLAAPMIKKEKTYQFVSGKSKAYFEGKEINLADVPQNSKIVNLELEDNIIIKIEFERRK